MKFKLSTLIYVVTLVAFSASFFGWGRYVGWKAAYNERFEQQKLVWERQKRAMRTETIRLVELTNVLRESEKQLMNDKIKLETELQWEMGRHSSQEVTAPVQETVFPAVD